MRKQIQPSQVKVEKLLVDAANSDDFSEHLEELQSSCFGTDIDCGRLGYRLYLVHDAVKTALPEVRQVGYSQSVLRRLKNYLRSTIKQDRLNNCLLICIVTNRLRTHWTMLRWQRGLLVPTNYAKDIMGNLSRGMRLA